MTSAEGQDPSFPEEGYDADDWEDEDEDYYDLRDEAYAQDDYT